ncbi:MAG: hypothetical protein ACRDVD_03785, partial [Acidimicrobiia bacterium]
MARLAVFVATVLASWAVLAYGTTENQGATLQAGDIADRDYTVVDPGPVTNVEAWTQAQEAARNNVEPVTVPRPETEEQVIENIEEFFATVAATVVRPDPDVTTSTTLPEEETTSTSSTSTTQPQDNDDESTTTTTATTIPPEQVPVQGFLFIDANGDGDFDPELAEDAQPGDLADVPLPMVAVSVESPGSLSRTESQSDGTFITNVNEGEVTITIDSSDPDYPDWAVSAGAATQTIECSPGDVCAFEPVGFDPALVSVGDVEAAMSPGTLVPDEALRTLAVVARMDAVAGAVGGEPYMPAIQRAAIEKAQSLFGQRIYEIDSSQGVTLEEAKIAATSQPPLVFNAGGQRDAEAGQAAGDVVANFLLANWTFDDTATGEEAEEAALAVLEEDYQVTYARNEVIASEGERLSSLQVDAIRQTTAGVFERAQQQGGLLAVLTVLTAVLALYLNRFRPEFWSRPRMVALLGILIVLAAGAVRATVFFEPYSLYVIPAVAFGLMTT